MQWVRSFVSIPVILIQLLFYAGVSEIILDKLVDSIWRLRQLWVHCYSVLCSSSLGTFPGTIAIYIASLASIVVNAILGGELLSCSMSVLLTYWNNTQVIMITRLHAMYQRSRKMLVFLSVIFLVLQIICVVVAVIQFRLMFWGELQL